jgi:hypothetical protein
MSSTPSNHGTESVSFPLISLSFSYKSSLLCVLGHFFAVLGARTVHRSLNQLQTLTFRNQHLCILTHWLSSKYFEPRRPGHGVYAESDSTVGAGDTFIAGILYSCLIHHDSWSLPKKLAFAIELAGRKVAQEGFANLIEIV